MLADCCRMASRSEEDFVIHGKRQCSLSKHENCILKEVDVHFEGTGCGFLVPCLF